MRVYHFMSNKLTTSEFITKSRNVHGDKYIYDESVYTDYLTPLCVICPIHGRFYPSPLNHISAKKGCTSCGRLVRDRKQSMTTDEFIQKSKVVHGDTYDYSLVKYTNTKTKVKIICKEHGVFEQIPNSHIVGKGCSNCISSNGESIISDILIKQHIGFLEQHRFHDCRYKKPLPFDFFIPSMNMCIEYDGCLHFIENRMIKDPIRRKRAFEDQQVRDQIKTKYCEDRQITLIRISYTEDIESKLKPILEANK